MQTLASKENLGKTETEEKESKKDERGLETKVDIRYILNL